MNSKETAVNKKRRLTFYGALLGLLLLVSCTPSEESALVPIEESYVNTQILLRAPSYSNTFRTQDPINLELKYNTSYEITFPNNYNLRIFENNSGKWVEIKEKPTERYPLGDVVLSPDKEMPAVQVVVLFPDLPFLERGYSLRIYVIGDMKANGEIVEVAAYTDVMLRP